MIDRKSRDRKGGHQPKDICDADGITAWTQAGRAFVKREGVRKARRQHTKAVRNALAEWHAELNDSAQQQLLEACQFDAFLDEYDDYQEEEEDRYDAYQDDSDSYMDYLMDHDYDYDHGPYVSVQDTDTADEFSKQVQQGYVSLDLELINRRDAGKTLGELLRERLQRPF